jgi:hypothetical protein
VATVKLNPRCPLWAVADGGLGRFRTEGCGRGARSQRRLVVVVALDCVRPLLLSVSLRVRLAMDLFGFRLAL